MTPEQKRIVLLEIQIKKAAIVRKLIKLGEIEKKLYKVYYF